MLRILATQVCERLQRNFDFFEQNAAKLNETKLRRVRHEDFVRAPSNLLTSIYKWLDKPVDKQVIGAWLDAEMDGFDRFNWEYQVRANSFDGAQRWRAWFSLDEVAIIQDKCSRVMNSLGYALLTEETSLRELKVPSLSSLV